MNSEVSSLVPSGEAWDTLKEVNTTTILRFLAGEGNIPSSRFSPQLNLSFLKTFLEDLYGISKNVKVFSEDMRNPVVEALGGLKQTPSIDELREIVNKEAPGERTLTIYYDPFRNVVGRSEIIFGEYSHTSSGILDVIKSDYYPLLEVHTHPGNSILSIYDYQPLLTDLFKDGERMTRGALVLCEDMQILALATAQTPLLAPRESNKFITDCDNRLDEEISTRSNRYSRRADLVGRIFINKLLKSREQVLEEIATFENKVSNGEISREEASKMTEDILDRRKRDSEEYALRHNVVLGRISQKIGDLEAEMINRILVEFARSINVKLYISNDMSNFKEFSA